MDVHTGKRLVGLAITIRIRSNRKREIGNEGEAVAGFDLDGANRRQRRADEGGARHIELLQALRVAVVDQRAGGRGDRIVSDHPDPAGPCLALNRPLTLEVRVEEIDVGLDRGVHGRAIRSSGN
jgi:hypothetical protein